MTDNKKAAQVAGTGTASKTSFDNRNFIPPIVTGQCAEVLEIISQDQLVQPFVLTADHAIPEAAVRAHNLRAMGFKIRTIILPEVEFRGVIRRGLHSVGRNGRGPASLRTKR